MKKSVLMAGVAAVVIGVGLLGSAERALGQTHKPGKNVTPTYSVVKIGDKYEVVSTTDMKTKRKQVDDENKKAMAKWKDEKKVDPKTPKPVKLVVKVIQPGFATQEGAHDFIKVREEKEKEQDDAKDKDKDAGGGAVPK